MKNILKISTMIIALLSLTGFTAQAAGNKLTGTVRVDGSSTVFPITEAMAEEFQKSYPRVRVTVGLSGTGGGMKKFYNGSIDITGASRPIKSIERDNASKNKIAYVELPVAFDGIAVVVSSKNTFAKSMTTAELNKLWQPNSKIKMWSDLRADWPKKPVKLYGPGADSGTFEYFTKVITGGAGKIRSDFTASEDDNVLVQGVKGDPYALGYFGYAYYAENKDTLNVVSIDGGRGAVTPSAKTIEDGSYQPLSRPIFIYVNKKSADRPEVEAFIKFYLENAPKLIPDVGYVPFAKFTYTAALERFNKRMLGTVFGRQVRFDELLALTGE